MDGDNEAKIAVAEWVERHPLCLANGKYSFEIPDAAGQWTLGRRVQRLVQQPWHAERVLSGAALQYPRPFRTDMDRAQEQLWGTQYTVLHNAL